MPSLLFSNTWSGGRNSDTNPADLPANQYRSADNVSLVESGNFYALQNIAGTTAVQQIGVLANYNVLAAFATRYLIAGETVNCITVFSAGVAGTSTQDFKIICYDTESDVLYELYEEAIDSVYNTVDRVIDVVNGPENSRDHLYFTDGYHEVRHLTCEIPDPYSANFLNSYDLSLLRRGANGTISLTSVALGGTLLSGVYQFCYRMADPTNKRFTKWSTLTNPIHCYSAENSTSVVNSGIGLITDRKITINITPSAEETNEFDHIQVAVVENVGPTQPITASLLEIEAIPFTSLSYEYKSNSRIGSIPIEDIVVDFAQLDTVKTLAIKDNRLFLGNINYTDLEFDNGVPSITSGSIITQASSTVDSFSDDEFSSKYKGHFRGEVYRYGLVYEDEYGNKSSVQVLDLSAVTANAITPGLTDLKFPDRTNASYTLFNSSGQIQSLGLRLIGLINHPTWARSVEVVRVDRVGRFKNVLFQTPVIPMSKINGIGALEDYPNVVTYSAAADSERTYEDATPMTSSYTLVPRNLYWPEHRDIIKFTSNDGSGTTKQIAGEVTLHYTADGYDYSMVWPSDSMYNPAQPFVYSGAEKLDFVDVALVKLSIDEDQPSTVLTGDDVKTNVSGTFYATADNQYYFNNGHAKSSVPFSTSSKPITDYEFFDNLGQTDSVAGKTVMDYEALQTGGINLGFKPNIQRSAVIKLGGNRMLDATESQLVFSAATWNAYHTGAPALTSASGTLKHEPGLTLTNKYINEYSGFSPNSSYVNVIGIANVHLGLGDGRYGESTDLQEFISTGAKYTFSEAEVATLEAGGSVSINLDVWGGDCFVSSHVFKVCDSTYSVVNQTKHNGSVDSTSTLMSKWNNTLFKDLAENCFLSIPVSVEGAAQFVQVVLESEYNGEVRESDILEGTSASIPVMEGEAGTARTPLTYRYNINLNKNNSQKIFVPKPQFSFEQNEFGSRVIYSDLKIYNSDQAGFDVFRVSNTYDIEEKYGDITKLAVAGNQLYSIHERGVIYLPTGERQIETSDAGTLAVRSGEVVGKHIVIDSKRGSQHLRGIVETGNLIYVPDNENKDIYALAGQQLQSITHNNRTIFRDMFASKIGGGYLLGVYDPERKEFWIADIDPFSANRYCHVWNETINEGRGGWVSNYPGFGRILMGAAYTNQNLYVIGVNASLADTSICTMYTGDYGLIFGNGSAANVEFVANPNRPNSKVFDNLIYYATERLSTVSYEVPHDTETGHQTGSTTLDFAPREGRYPLKVLRDASNSRMRGMYMLMTVTWKSIQSALNGVDTIFRLSAPYR